MQPGRRRFIAGLLAAGLVPRPTWADAGSPAYLSAATKQDGSCFLCGISDTLDILFQISLPARGHAATAHPVRPEAVAFARRPGTFAMVIDCISGTQRATLNSPQGRHFYGHGTYCADGNLLFTTENDYEAGRGRIGIWDVAAGYKRIGEFDSGGIGPHDIKRLPGTDTLVIANGGIDTHPDSGRTKLNIPTMRSNLTYIAETQIIETVSLPPDMQKNSIRHLSVSPSGNVAFGMQWQGGSPVQSLVGQHRQGQAASLLRASPEQIRVLEGYIGSIAFSKDSKTIATTSPRGGVVHLYDTEISALNDTLKLDDVCGVAPRGAGFVVSSGTGKIGSLSGARQKLQSTDELMWDNHLIAI